MDIDNINNINNINTQSPKTQLTIFIEGIDIIFKNWTALRLCIDNNITYISNHIIELLNEKEEIVEELEFNVKIGQVIDSICGIIKRETSETMRERRIAEVLKSFIEEFFFISLEDGSDIDITIMIIKLFNDVISNKNEYLNKIKGLKHAMQFHIDYPIKVEDLVNKNMNDSLCSSSEGEEDEEGEDEEEGDEEDNLEMKEILEGKYKKKKKKNEDEVDFDNLDINDKKDKDKDKEDIEDIEDGFEVVGKKKKKK